MSVLLLFCVAQRSFIFQLILLVDYHNDLFPITLLSLASLSFFVFVAKHKQSVPFAEPQTTEGQRWQDAGEQSGAFSCEYT